MPTNLAHVAGKTIAKTAYGFVCLLALQLLGGSSLLAQAPESPAQSPEPLGLLRLAGGDFVPGWLAASDEPGDEAVDKGGPGWLEWQYPQFSSPLRFDLATVSGASFPQPNDITFATGSHAIELIQGDRVYGDVLDADEWSVRLRTADFGELTVLRTAITRIENWNDGASMVFVGPGPLEQWKTSGGDDAWQSGGGGLRSKQVGASAYRNVGLPDRASIMAELSWEGTPNFVLAIGVDVNNDDASAAAAFRVEVWEGDVVLYRELDLVANVLSLGKLSEFDGVLRLHLELDQTQGRIRARSTRGETLGEFMLPSLSHPGAQPGIRLTNLDGNVSLDSFHVMRSSGVSHAQSPAGLATVYFTDGSVRSGRWTTTRDGVWEFLTDSATFHATAEQILAIEQDHADRQVSADQQASVDGQASEKAVATQLISHNGIRLIGEIRSVGDGRLNLQHDAIVEPVSFQNDQIARLAIEGAQRGRLVNSNYILGRLLFPGGHLTGQLIDTENEHVPTPIRFAIRGGNTVHLKPGFTGRMVYRESPPPETAQQRRVREQREAAEQRAAQRRQNQGGVWNVLSRAFGNNDVTERGLPAARAMHLRSGEVVPCEVKSIDQNEVVFTSEMTDQTKLPAAQIRAIAFTAGCRDPEVEAARRDRLLTIPRVRKKNRPTHLIVAKNNDMLRCRLIKLDEDQLIVETRLEKITIDRSVVAQIIWLKEDADDADTGENASDPDDAAKAEELAARAVLRNGNRMSLIVKSIEDSVVIGEHPLLGESRIKLGDVNELLLGVDLDEAGEGQPYNGWMLKDAPEPIIPDPAGGGGGDAGMSSALVGKEAPDFTLDLLGGGRFNLAEQRGKVVVLDFWASWCGPCLQAMPVIEQTVQQFDANEVRLVAVNLQETAEPIRGTLERLGISPEVALDIDGVAAARYQADAIPQTVVIGRDGKITRLFVGGGPQLADNLRDAIDEAIGETTGKTTGETTPAKAD